LLREDGELDDAEADAAVRLGDPDRRPAEIAELRPQRLVVSLALGGGAHLRQARAPGEQVVRGALDLLLLMVEIEVHVRFLSAVAVGRARARRQCSSGFRSCRPRSSFHAFATRGTTTATR